MPPPAVRRGAVYRIHGQADDTLGMLALSNNRRHKYGKFTGVPIRVGPAAGRITLENGHADVGNIVNGETPELIEQLDAIDPDALAAVEDAVAGLLLLPELIANPDFAPGSPDGDYPRWGSIYYAEPPIEGQIKRWLVVSHNHFNAATGKAVCLRTTSNTSLKDMEAPYIELGLALAVCPDVVTKTHGRFDLSSLSILEQVRDGEMRRVAIALSNYLNLHRAAGLFTA